MESYTLYLQLTMFIPMTSRITISIQKCLNIHGVCIQIYVRNCMFFLCHQNLGLFSWHGNVMKICIFQTYRQRLERQRLCLSW